MNGDPGPMQRALRLLAASPRSRAEIALRLERWGIGPAEIAATCERLTELGYLDDRRLAQDRAERLGGRFGPRAVEARLVRQGIDPGLARSAVAPLEASEEALARSLLVGRFGAGPLDPAGSARAARWLLGRGFDEELIRSLLF